MRGKRRARQCGPRADANGRIAACTDRRDRRAIAILVAFGLAQFGVLDQRAWSYLWLSIVGSVALAVDAFRKDQLGFLLLEGVWALIST
jgi:hypothetical protein